MPTLLTFLGLLLALLNIDESKEILEMYLRLTRLPLMFRLQTPHLVNLNEDPLMSECLLYYIKDGITR